MDDKMRLLDVDELEGPALDWAVAQSNDLSVEICQPGIVVYRGYGPKPIPYSPSCSWLLGGPLIECAGISLRYEGGGEGGGWYAVTAIGQAAFQSVEGHDAGGDTPLQAGMRCFVKKFLGEKIQVPACFYRN